MKRNTSTAILYVSALIAGMLCGQIIPLGCSKEPENAPQTEAPAPSVPAPADAPTGPSLPAQHLSNEIVAPGGSYTPDGAPTIITLTVGSSGWVRPWTMWRTIDGNSYINTGHSFRSSKVEKDWIKITRRDNGFLVELDHTPFEWAAIDIKGLSKNGDGTNMPVVEIRE